MPKNLRIVFYGTAEIAAIELEYLYNNGYNIAAVVTNIDKPMGRGKKIAFSPVKEMAINLGVEKILQPQSMKSEDFISELKEINPDLQIVVAFRMMPKAVYSLPRLGTFNLHTSLLPQYRGAAPINWAIINGETQTGITTFLLNEKIDCGEILLQEKIDIHEDTDFEALYNEMAEKGKKLIANTISLIAEGNFTTQPQTEEQTKPAPKIFKEDTYIDWHKNAEDIVNFIRGLCPVPSAKAVFIDESNQKQYEFKIFKARKIEGDFEKNIGEFWIDNAKRILVKCQNAAVELIDLQMSGKKRMLSSELVKGLRISTITSIM